MSLCELTVWAAGRESCYKTEHRTDNFVTVLCAAAAAVALFAAACGSPSSSASKEVVVWRAVGSWSGRGNLQTESFTSDSGSLRVRWETAGEASHGAGTFRLTARSAISGRSLKVAVEQQGPGRGTSYVNDDPHVFYMTVESANLDWSFTVDDAVAGAAPAAAK